MATDSPRRYDTHKVVDPPLQTRYDLSRPRVQLPSEKRKLNSLSLGSPSYHAPRRSLARTIAPGTRCHSRF